MTVVSHFFWNWYVFRNRAWVWRFAWGGVLPDAPYVFLLAYYSWRFRVNGFTDLRAWQIAWDSPLCRAFHSYVPWSLAVLVVGCVCPAVYRRTLAPMLGGWLTHIAADMLTHRSDGYPIFYPLSSYRFPTPLSYWEPAHYGRAFMLVDITGMLVLLAYHLATRQRYRTRHRLAAGGAIVDT